MKIFALFDNDGFLRGFWGDDLFPSAEDGSRNEKIPADAVEIDTATHRLLVEYPDAWRMVDGELVAHVPAPPTTEELREGMLPLSPRQLRLALVRSGTSLASVETAIAALPDGTAKEEADIEWEYATEFRRLAPALLTIADAIGLTPEAVDELWEQALTI